MQTRNVAAVAVVMLCVIWEAPARGQPAVPDMVELHDGRMARGTIIENVPGDHVTILLPTGEARTFAHGDVAYAGPYRTASEATTEAERSAAARAETATREDARSARRVRVRVESEQSGLTLHRALGELTATTYRGLAYRAQCVAPCEFELDRGLFRFGIGLGDGPAHEPLTNRLVTLEGDTLLSIGHRSREGDRTVGWTLVGIAVAVIIGSVITFAALNDDHLFAALGVFGGGAAVALGLGLGAIFGLTFQPDQFTLEVRPRGDD